MAREIELKFDVHPGARAKLAASRLFDGEGRAVPQETIYYDTPSGTVRRRGFSLRIRRSRKRWIQTVKFRRERAAGLFNRDEWETDVAGPELDFDALEGTPLARWLTPGVRRKLHPVVRTTFDRTTWRLDSGASRIEATLDEGEIEAGDIRAPLAELEVELRKGDTAALFELAERLSRVVPLRLGVMSKAERGFAMIEGRLDEPSKAEPVRLGADMRVADAFAAAAHSCVRQFRLNEPLVLERRHADALHQARVAIRRLRSALALFRPIISDWEFERVRLDLRWLASELGAARNLDVLLARLTKKKRTRGAADELRQRREEAYDHILALLDSQRCRSLMLNMIRWIETGGWRSRARASKRLSAFAADQIERRWRRVRMRGEQIGELDSGGLHLLRIDAKKMRYSAEFLSGVHEARPAAKKRDSFIAALEDLQDRLGALNDAETARTIIGSLGLGEAAEAELEQRLLDAAKRDKALAAAEAAFGPVAANAGYWS